MRLKREFDPNRIFNPGRLYGTSEPMETHLADWLK
jgi:hypothetical protein